MNKLFDKIYEKSELRFALMWIVIYCVTQSLAIPISKAIGIDSSAAAVINIVLTIVLFFWLKERNLFEKYGLCRASSPASKFLFYIPLVLIISHNLWYGAALNLPVIDTAFYICSMLCVGFLEEVIFRGFLFKALARDNVKTAIIISSVTFGLGHLLNLVNGRGMELFANIWQVVGAIVLGFLFVIIFYRGGSLIPCIITHSLNNAVSVFAKEAGMTVETRLLLSALNLLIVIVYSLILLKTLPKKA